MPSGRSIADELRTLREQLFAIANQSDGAGTYLFGGQGATQKPFVDAPGGVQFAATGGADARPRPATDLPLTTDGQAAWLQARTGNGVFVTSAAAGVPGATIDSGRVTDPSALTGSDYTLAVQRQRRRHDLRGAARTACRPRSTAAPYVSGQAITIDGMTVAVSGTPAQRRPVRDRAVDADLVGLRHARPGDRRPADDRPHRLADRPGNVDEPARHRFGDGHACRRRAPPPARC